MLGPSSRSKQTWQDLKTACDFLLTSRFTLPFPRRYQLVRRFWAISDEIDCPHTQSEILAFASTILSLDEALPGCVVEAGCYKGGSTAKFSLAAAAARRRLVVFDSFQGIPAHTEDHGINIYGRPVTFAQGEYRGSLEEVSRNVRRFGDLPACSFIPGWFEDTLPGFDEPIASIYLDVDLACSTRTCLKYLYPRLQLGGTLYSQDGHLPLVLEVFDDEEFWLEEVGCRKPEVHGFGHSKLLTVIKTETCTLP